MKIYELLTPISQFYLNLLRTTLKKNMYLSLILVFYVPFFLKMLFLNYDFYELFLKPYESYTTFKYFKFIAATFGMLSVYFLSKKTFGSILLVLFLLLYMYIFFLYLDF